MSEERGAGAAHSQKNETSGYRGEWQIEFLSLMFR
jgi:hypothetical protein